jgi:DNA-binding CsgD family transcriptional regulator
VVQSPVLVGRDDLLALARRRLDAAASGAGHLLLVAGEAGIGKTRLLDAIATLGRAAGFVAARATAFPGDAETSAGLVLDLASTLGRSADPGFAAAGRAMAERLRATAADDGDAHRRRRLLIADLVDLVPAAQTGPPLLLLLEDVHWADQLSLDVLAGIAARLRERRSLVAVAYRSDELYPRVPMRSLRARLLAQRLAEEVRLPRLSLDETATLTASVLGYPAPQRSLTALHTRSDGIPLHIEELLAAMSDEAIAAPIAATDGEVPETLAEVILARAANLPTRTRSVAAAAAVIGRSFDFDLLATVADAPEDTVATALRDLQQAYLVLPGSDPTRYDFRHALIRDALYQDTALPARRRLHERVAVTAASRGYRPAFVSAHFERALRAADAYRYALIAADEAVAVSAHRVALELYRRAARHEPADTDASARAELRTSIGDEAAATDDNGAAAEAYEQAIALYAELGDRRAAAALVPRLVDVRHLLGAGLDERLELLNAAKRSVTGDDAQVEIARLDAAIAAAYMLDRRLDQAIAYGTSAREASRRVADERTEVNAASSLGAVYVFAGRMGAGWDLMADAIRRSSAAQREAEAARGYRMLGTSASVLVEYDRAEQWLTEGITYADRAELWNHRHYMAAHVAHVQWATGRYAEATRTAEHALADGRGGITTRITALYVLGYLALGADDLERAARLLQEAYAEAEAMHELQRLSPPLWGRAELAVLSGEPGAAIDLCEQGYALSRPVGDAAYLFPFLVTGVRAHVAAGDLDAAEAWASKVAVPLWSRSLPGAAPALDHARGLIDLARGETASAGSRLDAAVAGWTKRRRFWEAAWGRLDQAALATRMRRHAEAARLIDAVAAEASTAGADALVRAAKTQRSGRAAEPWSPLSAREFEVARLVAEGLTNRQIAERLTLAPKTISAHIEHILTKLEMARRAEVAAWVTRIDA